MNSDKKNAGFSITEVMITLAIGGIMIGIAIPNYLSWIHNKKLQKATENLYSFIKKARENSLEKTKTMYLSFIDGSQWCVGISDTSVCNCNTSAACTVDGTETIMASKDFSGISLSLTGLSKSGSLYTFSFENVRGTASSSSGLTFSMNNASTTINTNKMGLMSICSKNFSSYPSCAP